MHGYKDFNLAVVTDGDAVFDATDLFDFVGSFFDANAIVSLSATFIFGQLPLKAFMPSLDLQKF